jgi:hypothetical protein
MMTGLVFVSHPLQAAFLDDGWGARPVGMGGAFSAIADDSNAPLFNPAGITQVQWNEMTAMYASLYSGLTLYSGNDTVNLGQSYLAFVAKPNRHFGSWGISWANFTTTHLYREDTVSLTYARNVGDLFPVFDNMLSVGTNIKYLHRGVTLDSLTANDPVFAGGSTANALTFDLGLLFKPEEGPLAGFRAALVGQNLNQPNVGFQEDDAVPTDLRLGFAYQAQQIPWLVPDLDLEHRNGITEAHFGIESWLFHDTLGLRTGVNSDEVAAGVSFYQAFDKKFGFRLDYGFTFPFFIQDTNGSQRLAITLYF